MTEHVALASAVAYAALSPVIEYMAPAPAVTHGKPAPVIEYVAPVPVIEYVAPAPAATCSAPSQQFPPSYTMAAITTGARLDTTGLMNSQCSITAVQGSPLGEPSAPKNNQVRQELLFIAEETTQNMAEITTVHEPVTAQKLSEILENLDTMIHGLSPSRCADRKHRAAG